MTSRERLTVALVLGAAITYQAYAALLAVVQAPTFMSLFVGLGAELPLATRAFIATRVFWPLVPLGFIGLAVDVLRRETPSPLYLGVSVGSSMATGFAMHAWFHQALFAPLLEILKKIG